jgi:hypothetical protein
MQVNLQGHSSNLSPVSPTAAGAGDSRDTTVLDLETVTRIVTHPGCYALFKDHYRRAFDGFIEKGSPARLAILHSLGWWPSAKEA